jgi:UrcA family protein
MPRYLAPLLAALALTPVASLAQEPTAEVRFDDLNLATPAGQAALEQRIETAARAVCRNEAATGTRIANPRREQACRADVRRQIDARITAQRG